MLGFGMALKGEDIPSVLFPFPKMKPIQTRECVPLGAVVSTLADRTLRSQPFIVHCDREMVHVYDHNREVELLSIPIPLVGQSLALQLSRHLALFTMYMALDILSDRNDGLNPNFEQEEIRQIIDDSLRDFFHESALRFEITLCDFKNDHADYLRHLGRLPRSMSFIERHVAAFVAKNPSACPNAFEKLGRAVAEFVEVKIRPLIRNYEILDEW